MANIHSYDDDVSFEGFDRYIEKTWKTEITKMNSFQELIQHIENGIAPDNLQKEVFIARGFLLCLHRVQYEEIDFRLDGHSWNGDMPGLFDTFCSCANIECKMIGGKTKGSNYTVGDETIVGCESTWCVFKENNKWHLFNPVWCVSCSVLLPQADEIMIEKDGEKAMDHTDDFNSAGFSLTVFNDDWFCTKPEVFQIFHLPDDPEWQLCKKPISLTEWLDLPLLEPDFFKLNLRLLGNPSAKVEAENGKCVIQILAEHNEKRLVFSNRLYLSSSDHANLDSKDWGLLVLSGRDKGIFMFEIRFPVKGKYRFELLARHASETLLRQCCDFSIMCDTNNQNCKKLPIDTGIHGYGFGYFAEEGGLSKPSVPEPKLFPNKEEKDQRLTFKVNKDEMDELEYGSVMYVDGQKIAVSPKRDEKRRQISVDVQMDTDANEYAVMVGKRPKNSQASLDPLVYYMVSKDDDTSYRENVEEAQKEKTEFRKSQIKDEKQQKQEFLTTKRDQLTEKIKFLESNVVVAWK